MHVPFGASKEMTVMLSHPIRTKPRTELHNAARPMCLSFAWQPGLHGLPGGQLRAEYLAEPVDSETSSLREGSRVAISNRFACQLATEGTLP
jgi:hypothetical protein